MGLKARLTLNPALLIQPFGYLSVKYATYRIHEQLSCRDRFNGNLQSRLLAINSF